MSKNQPPEEPAQVLERMIKASGLSARRFASEVLAGRDERTIRRWLAGETMPPKVLEWLYSIDRVQEEMGGLTITLRWGQNR